MNIEWDEGTARERLALLNVPLDRAIGRLSGGQQAQVSLALALAKRPGLLLLDEPLAALAPIARRDFMSALMDVVADRAVTVVLSSHVVAELERCCDHLIALHHGRVQVAGDIGELVDTHVLLTGPAADEEQLRRTHAVVSARTTGRQTTAVVRRGREPFDPRWHQEPVNLEELVLTYLREPDAAALPGPTVIQREATT
jgi:ABC-2 type transport system ATP-binding protein